MEFALNDGKSVKYDRYVAARTGDPREFKTYEQFLNAVKEQIRYVLRCMVAGNQVTTEIVYDMECPVASLTFKECLEKGADYAWVAPSTVWETVWTPSVLPTLSTAFWRLRNWSTTSR